MPKKKEDKKPDEKMSVEKQPKWAGVEHHVYTSVYRKAIRASTPDSWRAKTKRDPTKKSHFGR